MNSRIALDEISAYLKNIGKEIDLRAVSKRGPEWRTIFFVPSTSGELRVHFQFKADNPLETELVSSSAVQKSASPCDRAENGITNQ
jgi:hypothetical protein